jgi:hypothetical protein
MNNFIIKVPQTLPIINIVCQDRNLADILISQYYPYVESIYDITSINNDEIMKIIQNGDSICVVSNETIRKVANIKNPLKFTKNIIHRSLYCKDDFVIYHGCGMSTRGFSFLLLGQTFSGKSTLAAFLYAKGLQYLTDDFVILDTKNLSIIPYPKPIHLRYGGKKVLENYHDIYLSFEHISYTNYERWIIKPDLKSYSENSFPVNCIFFIKRYDRKDKVKNREYYKKNKFKSLDSCKSACLLIDNLYSSNGIRKSIIKTYDVIKNVPAVMLYYYTLDEAYSIILEILNLYNKGHYLGRNST